MRCEAACIILIITLPYPGEGSPKSCPSGCLHGNCTSNGRCTDGCRNGYYGNTCYNVCRTQCRNTSCKVSPDTGSAICTLGCQDGWKGVNCEQRCPRRCAACNESVCFECENFKWYGTECETYCRTCKENTCHRNGTCKLGCTGPLKGPRCDCHPSCTSCDRVTLQCHSCIIGNYGSNCSRRCSSGCVERECMFSNGSCTRGCVAGGIGPFCIEDHSEETRSQFRDNVVSHGRDTQTVTDDPYTSSATTMDGYRVQAARTNSSNISVHHVTIIIGTVTGVLVLISICVIISLCCGEKKKKKQVPENSQSRTARHIAPDAGIYDEICECDVRPGINGICQRESGYITPIPDNRDRRHRTHEQHHNIPTATSDILNNHHHTHRVTIPNGPVSAHNNQAFSERLPRRTIPGVQTTGDRADVPAIVQTGSECSSHPQRSRKKSPRSRSLPRQASDKHGSRLFKDKRWTLESIVSPLKNSPALRKKFAVNSRCEQVLGLMAEDSSSEDERAALRAHTSSKPRPSSLS